MRQREALGAQRDGQVGDLAGRGAERAERGDLRADVDVQADDLQPGRIAAGPQDVGRIGERHAELAGLEPGGDVRRGSAASTSGLTRSATRTRRPWARASASMRSSSPADSALIAFRSSVDGAGEFVGRLADAGEDDLIGTEPGARRQVDLADGVGVGVGAALANQPRDGERRVRLQGVMQRVRPVAGRRAPAAAPASRAWTTGAL